MPGWCCFLRVTPPASLRSPVPLSLRRKGRVQHVGRMQHFRATKRARHGDIAHAQVMVARQQFHRRFSWFHESGPSSWCWPLQRKASSPGVATAAGSPHMREPKPSTQQESWVKTRQFDVGAVFAGVIAREFDLKDVMSTLQLHRSCRVPAESALKACVCRIAMRLSVCFRSPQGQRRTNTE